MKIYCSSCDKVQPVIIDDCRDAKTNEPYQDIVCEDCHLVIASGKDIRRPWVGLTDEERNDCLVEADPCECLATPEAEELMRCIETKLKERNT